MDFNIIEEKVKENKEKIGWTNKRPFMELTKIIPDNETLFFAISGLMKKNGVTVIGITETNIYIVAEPMAGMALTNSIIPLDRVTSVASKGGVFGSLQIAEGTVVHVLENISPANASNAVSAFNKAKMAQPKPQHSQVSEADELIKFKKLLDDGVLTQEEFDKKKAQILGL
ncbi:MAG: SHOCT domain-containing protein [Treponema sp.]|nr:SHOCT domain-containing protein [Treponema sp.]